MSVEEKRMCIEKDHLQLSIRRQCDLLGLGRSSFYYEPIPIGEEDILLMREIDEIYTRMPYYGVPRMTKELKKRGFAVGKKRVRRLMREMNIQAIYPKPNLSLPRKENPVYPYLLKDLPIIAPNQVWCADITYISMRRGFVYLVAIMDWYSRFVLSWEISGHPGG
jgi:putative transposase